MKRMTLTVRFLMVAGILIANGSHADKPSIGHSAYDGWPSLAGDVKLGRARKYVAYTYTGERADSILVLQSVDGKWQREFLGCGGPPVTATERFAIFRCQDDRLGIARLGTENVETISGV